MEHFDEERLERIWQRVRGRAEDPPRQAPLKELLFLARENSAAYASLWRQNAGKDARLLRQLHRQSEQTAACLLGISRLLGEQAKLLQTVAPKLHPRRVLEQAWHRESKLRRELAARSSDPDHGAVFERLAGQAGQRCLLLAQLLGRSDR